ncbi:type II toxin-antitoxin system VapC family toxin [Alloacidobacterium dinghuense]|uniref:Type II toxin-antitoxin system VapC family toxin n=1 Tax=Alloacidobacterium dinghuense TaxID=2763107 RepID=A0A7G8BI29_9BACT|nr:type II toxin-antitoxin system VapC family toxin [Alloacidobacterium dinghuense]QNI32199.1 type II toxin-antitoxin system VapC family toxin [Alloacidobacterium dinghuense]
MFLLDTNVVSELRRAKTGKADRNVLSWAKGVPSGRLFLSVISVLELEIGILLIERRDHHQGGLLRSWMEEQVLPSFHDRIVAIDTLVAQRCAALHVPDPCSDRDALIAATALVHGMTIVTRNTADFELTGVSLLNPWLD